MTDWNNWLSWWRPHPPEYIAAKRDLRIARLIASAIHVDGPAWSACRKHQSHLKSRANAAVNRLQREIERLRERHGIPVVELWKPLSVSGLDRIRRQYTGSPGWDNTIGVRFDEHGPYWAYPAVAESAPVDPPIPAAVNDPQPSCPATIEIAPIVTPDPIIAPVVTAPDLNPPGPAVEIQDEITPMINLRTIGQLAKELRVDQHQALYVIRTRKIQPVARAGAYRLFDSAAVKRIASELKQIAAVR